MNLLLLDPREVDGEGTAVLTGRRFRHAREVLHVQVDQQLRVGVRGGLIGTAVVMEQTRTSLTLRVAATRSPPPRANVDLILALPRPKALKRVLSAIASMGVDRLFLINAARVSKSYFDSRVLEEAFLRAQLDEGLEQAQDTRPPAVIIRERFRPFVEDELPALACGARCFLTHPAAEEPLYPVASPVRVMLAIGPEGGWVPFELSLLQGHGFQPVTLGPRTLRVEVVVPALLGAVRAGAPRLVLPEWGTAVQVREAL